MKCSYGVHTLELIERELGHHLFHPSTIEDKVALCVYAEKKEKRGTTKSSQIIATGFFGPKLSSPFSICLLGNPSRK